MLVSEINPNKIKIVLTDTEVLCCFCSYEKLLSMSDSTKNLIKALLRDIVREHSFTNCEKLTVQIRAGKNSGCVIILTGNEQRKKINLYTAEFTDSESLIKAAFYLKSNRKYLKRSRLYSINNAYRLLLESEKEKDYFLSLHEFCERLYTEKIQFEYTKEYGTPIIKEKAVSKIAEHFIRGS